VVKVCAGEEIAAAAHSVKMKQAVFHPRLI
jgi:hypothetical protein